MASAARVSAEDTTSAGGSRSVRRCSDAGRHWVSRRRSSGRSIGRSSSRSAVTDRRLVGRRVGGDCPAHALPPKAGFRDSGHRRRTTGAHSQADIWCWVTWAQRAGKAGRRQPSRRAMSVHRADRQVQKGRLLILSSSGACPCGLHDVRREHSGRDKGQRHKVWPEPLLCSERCEWPPSYEPPLHRPLLSMGLRSSPPGPRAFPRR